ncbi:PREDICTED: molybdate-anion transporter-like isoform X4 [Nelumbo nucifera]|uniref:Molybdate-anion transporter-like isoform X4 n=1 Tax=Nelumbo nucifera TaxID=4432 RepID=A0A1U8B7T3_NELNU|nr:PREDICTED: molybdate-anion transporter-like isoform X4 [Nelumbo nucifera]
MGVVIETVVWEPKPLLHIFLFCSSFFCVFLLPCMSTISNRTSTYLDLDSFSTSIPASFLRFQRSFLLVYSLASVMEGLESIYGEFEYAYYGLSKEHMVVSLCAGSVASLLIGTSLGILSDIIGQRKVCVLFCFLHLVVGFWKSVSRHPSVWMASICLSLASSIFSFGFETWMVVEHDKLGYRKDLLNDTFWLMAFYESASLIGSQALANWLIGDKRVWFLAWAQACLQFSVAVFWILWAPTIVADGREVNLGMIYPCLLGARMLGSTTVPWFFSGPSPVRTEDCLLFAFLTSGFVLSIVAYDYQDIGFLVTLFCLFHACVGLILPSLARLRTMYIPNELRGGMISLSAAPASAVVLLVLIQKGYYQNIGNAVVMAFAAFGLFTAAGCMHLLKRWGKQPHHDVHKLG